MVVLSQIKNYKQNTTYRDNELRVSQGNIRGVCLSLKSRIDIGMNDPRFPFVLGVMILNLLGEGRRTYSLCRICVCH